MPTDTHFLRDHFGIPDLDPEGWTLELAGDGRGVSLTLDDLKGMGSVSLSVVLECAGHRRSEYEPAARGVGWGIGAVSEAVWTGVRLRDVLELLGTHVLNGHVLLEGADAGLVGDAGTYSSFARGIPLDKAMDEDTILAWEMNGEPLPRAHGAPLRAIVPGWYATDSVKWLARIEILDAPFAGHFEVSDYRLSTREGATRMTTLPISSLITSHGDGAVVSSGLHDLERHRLGRTRRSRPGRDLDRRSPMAADAARALDRPSRALLLAGRVGGRSRRARRSRAGDRRSRPYPAGRTGVERTRFRKRQRAPGAARCHRLSSPFFARTTRGASARRRD